MNRGGKTPFAYDYDKEAGMLVVNGERKVIFLVRSKIVSLSNWANTERIPIIALPNGVVVSKLSLTEIKPI